MTVLLKRIAQFASVLLLAMPALAAAPDAVRMEEIIQSYAKSGQFMGSVLVWKDGQTLIDKGYGYANLEWQVTNAPDSKFRIGSMTKQFTAVAILLLQERGKLAITDPVRKYIPDAPAAWDKITLYHLLTHTSGIPNFTDLPDHQERARNPVTPAEELAWFKDKPLNFPPGTKWNYSNSGYSVLGMVIEKASGLSYQQFLTDNFFTPLGMKNTGYDSNKTVIANHAYGYAPGKDGVEVAAYNDMTVPYAAGALYSTTHDILIWDQALFGGKVLKPASLKTMMKPFLDDYGCGFWIKKAGGHTDVTHAGGINGFNTDGHYLPDDKLAVVVMANLNGPAAGEVAEKMVKVALGEPVVLASERKEVAIDPAGFDALAGIYQIAPKFSLTFSRDGGSFYVQGTGQPRVEIFPLGPREFFAKVVDAVMRFEVDANGRGTKVILHQGGRDMPGPRVN
ncbi:serine hydrolase [Rhizomicrobium electricum]|uniref:Beta-lactamase-related domain-containing protein n=1 Tax=Rhizomicrobium electricum TaxID=480070 RepID=A0ABP3P3F1_9PROT|nr:serine hydrolase [Rhizomicrobium electricum]NIJ47325.1 CubicO group peptidase (beta-lactamase class C family) [Rhizomicrobium electricum]